MILEKKDILNIGVGEAGGNLVNEIMGLDSRYSDLCINSNERDTRNLKNINDIYILKNAMGTGKNRTRGKQIFIADRKNIIDQITKYKTQKVINIFFSMGGGTGSSIAPLIIKSLEMFNIDKIINIICIKPSLKEDKRYRKNALECWNELISLNNITSFYILDNETRKNNITNINKEFAQSFDLFMSTPKLEKTDNTIDVEELATVSQSKGAVMFYLLPNKKEDPKVALATAEKNSIFAELDDNNNHKCEYLIMALQKDKYDYEEVSSLFKVKEFKLCGYNNLKNNDLNLIIATGLNLQKTTMEELDLSLQEDEENEEVDEIIDKKDLKIDTDIITKQEERSTNNNINDNDLEDKLNDDALWDNLLNM